MPQQDPEAIQREIDRTRQELAQTLDAIADKVSPRKHLDRGKAKAKEALEQSKAKAKDGLEQGKAKAKEGADSARHQVEARRGGTSGSGSGSGVQAYDDGRGGQLYYSSGRELRMDRVAMAGAALAAVLVYLARRRRRG